MTIRNNALTGATQKLTTEHPTGLTIVVGGAVVVIAKRLGVELSTEEGVAIVVVLGAIVSKLSPRFDAKAATASNVPAHGGTGPDSV